MPRRAKGPHLYFRERERRWYIRDGSKEKSTGCGDGERDGAEAALQAYLSEKHAPDFGRGDPGKVLITDVLLLYAKERVPHLRAQEVVYGSLPHLSEFWERMMCSQLTPSACRSYVRWRTEQPKRAYKDQKTAPLCGVPKARRELEVLSAAIHYAHKEHKLLYPIPITMPERSPPRDRWLTRSEAARLVWAAYRAGNVHAARFILIGLYTGTRHRAILALRWIPNTTGGWVDLDRRMLYRAGSREIQSRNKRRTPVPLSDRLAAHLRRWKGMSATHVIEFRGEPVARMRQAFDKARVAAGLDATVVPHILRHTFATWAVQAGHPLSHVAEALGTREDIIQSVYGHHAPERLRGLVNRVARQ